MSGCRLDGGVWCSSGVRPCACDDAERDELVILLRDLQRLRLRLFIERQRDALAAVTTPEFAARVFEDDLAALR